MSKESESEHARLPAVTGALGNIVASAVPRMTPLPTAIHGVLNVLSTDIGKIFREYERNMAPLREAIEQLGVLHTAAAKVHDQVLDALLSRGWCHSYRFTDALIIHLGQLVAAGKGDKVDVVMAEFTKRESAGILANACEKYPARAAIITDAFEAHMAQKYTLSIPTLLGQLDGIGCEVMGLGRDFFNKKKRTNALGKLVSEFELSQAHGCPISGTDEQMLKALKREWGITQDTSLRSQNGEHSPLNRHGVIHGLDTDYPTEFNSLRCILKLGYILEVRRALHEDIPRHLRAIEQIVNEDAG